MRNAPSTLLRLLFALALGFAALLPLRAQMDPRLQNGNTDFMDLYQQSSSLKPKPEIATIVDCSGSMASLMFHPLYMNNDINDADDYRWMQFALTNASTSSTYSYNTYTITAKDSVCTGATATYTVTVNSSGAVTGVANTPGVGCGTSTTTAPTYTIKAYANGDSSAYTTLVFTPTGSGANPSYTVSSGTNTGAKTGAATNSYDMQNGSGSDTAPTISIVSATHSGTSYGTSMGTTYPTGTAFSFKVWMAHSMTEGEVATDEYIDWSASSGSNPSYSNPPVTVTSAALYSSTSTWTIPTFTPTVANPTQLLPITVSPTGQASWVPGTTVLTLSTYYKTLPSSPGTLTWTVSNSGGNSCSAGSITGSPTTATTTGPNSSVTWTIPAYCAGTSTTTPCRVTVTLNPTVGISYTATGITYLTGNLSNTTIDGSYSTTSALRKPDGTPVEATDADAAETGAYASPSAPCLAYEKYGRLDVRNWIRAASHVRFQASVKIGSTSYTRTIDIPIPWKITDASQTWTNPLTSTTVADSETETSLVSGAEVTTTYGSGLNIEMDQTYKVENAAGAVLAADTNGTVMTASATTTAYLYGVVYRPAYISWLFTGTYQSTNASAPGYTTNSTLLASAGKNFIAFDALNGALVPNQGTANVAWGQAFGPTGSSWGNITVPGYSSLGVYTGVVTEDASLVATPSLTRLQAVKRAAIQTWVAHQGDVYWALRELDVNNEAGSGTATTFNNSSLTTLSASNPATTHLNGQDSGWTVFNNTTTQGINSTTGNSVTAMARLSHLFANSETPLTYALARTLAQFEDPNSVFNAVEGSNVSQCQQSFLILFTDGADNNGQNGYPNTNSTTPYIQSSSLTINGTGGGNETIIATPTSINRSGSYWNLPTFAGIAAHLSDPTMGTLGTDYMAQWTPSGTTTGTPATFLPYAISQRGDASTDNNLLVFSKNHQVTTMTVGVSLGGTATTSGGPKQNLFWAAVTGDPSTTSGALSSFHGFVPPTGTYGTSSWVANDWVSNPSDPSDYPTVGERATGAVYFFDGSNPTTLASAMNYAFKIAIGTASNNTTASPSVPMIGATLGNEIYMGSFQPPSVGGVIWPGDLMMFSSITSSGTTTIVDTNGVAATTLNTTTAEWSASASLAAHRYWDLATASANGGGSLGRNLYTRLPGSSTTPEPALIPFTYTNSAITALLPSTLTATQKKEDVEFAMGGDITTATSSNSYIATANRSNMMGDIIDSAPAVREYTWSYVKPLLSSYSSVLAAAAGTGQHFRLIMVGDNQGWMHAFGEVTWTVTDPANSAQTLTKGVVDELWAFMPTDFLPYLDYITHATYSHRYMVDGSASIFFKDLPVSGTGPGNGTVDPNETAIAVFGLGKGGRSYYALNVVNPFVPTLQWSLRPDEAATFVTTRDQTGNSTPFYTAILPNMGFSSCTPAFGLITANSTFYNAVFLGGGFSVPEIETANFSSVHLGRSVMAVDVLTGNILAAQDLRATSLGGTSVGPVGANVVPFQFINNSGMAQRAYFMDYYGGLWSWGSKDVVSYSPYQNFRNDSSELMASGSYHGWQIRKVFQDDNTSASGLGARYTTPPVPFRVSSFPGPAYNSQAVPAAVGIAMVSGDRNNPLDRSYTSSNVIPKWHQLTMVFDRQDSRTLGLDNAVGSGTPDTGIVPGITVKTSITSSSSGVTSLLVPLNTSPVTATPTNTCTDLVFQAFTQGCTPDSYFLGTSASPKYGYYVDFPIYYPGVTNTSTFLSKGISAPLVLNGSLSYDYFTPLTSDPCTGGTGSTYSWYIADVLHPIVDDQRTSTSTLSGLTMTWNGVASGFIANGTSILQVGMVTNATGTNTPYVKSVTGPSSSIYPRVRVWRTVQ